MKSSDTAPAKSLAILGVGDPGTGKSRLEFAFPHPGILDIDLNLNSAIEACPGKAYEYSQPLRECPETKYLPSDDEELQRFKRSSDLWKFSMSEAKKLVLHPKTETMVIDGLSKLSEWGLDHCRLQLLNAGINLKKEFFAPYGAFIPLMSNFITTMRLTHKPLYVTCHQTTEQKEINKAWYYSLAIPGQLKDRLGGLFTDVWGLSHEVLGTTVDYYISTIPTNLHVGLKQSIKMDPKIKITGMGPEAVWKLLAPKLSTNFTHVPSKNP